jgi:hypothetical protein
MHNWCKWRMTLALASKKRPHFSEVSPAFPIVAHVLLPSVILVTIFATQEPHKKELEAHFPALAFLSVMPEHTRSTYVRFQCQHGLKVHLVCQPLA